jgi:glycosyltransferase involved in cell wall biosynthesis
MPPGQRIGFISTRLSGTDGVSLETAKWVKVFEGLDHTCFCFAGESDWPEGRSYIVPEAHFEFPLIRDMHQDLFDDYLRSPQISYNIERLKNHLKDHLHRFLHQFELDLIVVENALAIPMNIPLGLALTEVIAETGIPTIGHHHDFAWERARFSVSAADDYLRAAFPPTLHSVVHVVINTFAQHQLASRTGLSSRVVPNVMDFDNPPPAPDGYADDLRAALDIPPDDYVFLQPTRIVPRKRIERAAELAKWLGLPCTLVISHSSGDEGSDYFKFLQSYFDLLQVKVRFAHDRFGDERGQTPDGRKVYALRDAYHNADLITYPSTIEGFGNAFLETIYFRKPIVMSTYEIYRVDIRPKGFKVIEFGDFVTEETVQRTHDLLVSPDAIAETVEVNYQIARRHYSYTNLEKHLVALLDRCLGEE